MSNLPDLNTDDIGYIQYWNAIDQGNVSEIDPVETTSYSEVVDYTLYDNGLEGTVNLVTGATATFRVKNDGWVIVYGPSETDDTINQNVEGSEVRGRWDIINDWSDTSTTGSLVQSSYERAINGLAQEFSNWNSMDYSSSEVGIYDYDYPDAAGITYLYQQEAKAGEDTQTILNPAAQYTDGTDVYYAICTGAAYASRAQDYSITTRFGAWTSWDGATLASTGNVQSELGNDETIRLYGSLDMLAGGHFDSAGTEYSGELEVDGDDYAMGHIVRARMDLIASWG
jgi:hypothetical protein